jgi:serine phosphatase RsbU (regulator of sigma subunit)
MKTQRHVILVEDDSNVLHELRHQVASVLPNYYIIETANDGFEGLELVNEIVSKGGVIPLIITDHQMPNMSGSEFILKLSDLIPKCRNIMLTGQAQLTDVTELINQQALFRYMQKPWSISDLRMTVLSALQSYNQEEKLDKLQSELVYLNNNLEILVTKRTKELEVKTKELNNGLNYGSLMQSSLLPSENVVDDSFNRIDVLYRPYDRVSGDFYSFHKISDKKTVIVLGDATGHGVAGAFLSSICMTIIENLIENLIENQKYKTPFEMLTNVLTRFRDLAERSNVDGMKSMISIELTIAHFDEDKKRLSYASNSIQTMLFKKGELVEPDIKTFQCCLGNTDSSRLLKHRGKTAEISYEEFDQVLLFSDGIIDQFLQVTGKKMGRKRLQQELGGKSPQDLDAWFAALQGEEDNVDDATLLNIFI